MLNNITNTASTPPDPYASFPVLHPTNCPAGTADPRWFQQEWDKKRADLRASALPAPSPPSSLAVITPPAAPTLPAAPPAPAIPAAGMLAATASAASTLAPISSAAPGVVADHDLPWEQARALRNVALRFNGRWLCPMQGCSTSFTQDWALVRHLAHTSTVCVSCGQDFSRDDSLGRHQTRYNGDCAEKKSVRRHSSSKGGAKRSKKRA